MILEAARAQVVEALQDRYDLETINRVAVSVGTTDDMGPGMIIFVEASLALAATMANAQPYEYPAGMWACAVAVLGNIIVAQARNTLMFDHSELVALVLADEEKYKECSIALDYDRGAFIVPGEVLDIDHNTIPHPWSNWLGSQPWFERKKEGNEAWLRLCITPDLNLDALDQPQLEQLVDLSSGWNFSRLLSPELRQHKIAEFREFMTHAQIVE